MIKGGAERARELVRIRQQRIPFGTQDRKIELAVEERDFETVRGGRVAMRRGNPVNQTFEAKAAQVIGHLGRGIGAAEERCDMRAEVAVVKTAWQMREAGDRLEQ